MGRIGHGAHRNLDPSGPEAPEHPGGLSEGSARRHDIVDEEHRTLLERRRVAEQAPARLEPIAIARPGTAT